MWRRVLLVAVVLGAIPGLASAHDLSVGDRAPKLAVKEFVRGEPVADFEKGKVYVVEFWATWCGPCKAAIPHLTELQKKYPNVAFVGVSIWEEDQSKVKPFVDDMGEKMAYRVAVDSVPEGGKRDEGAMSKTWMKAAGQPGIPRTFIVNGEGKIAWVGHPMQLDKPLEQIVRGDWDLEAAAVKFKAERAIDDKTREALARVRKAEKPEDKLAALDQAIKEEPKLEVRLGTTKFGMLVKGEDEAKAAAYARHLAGGPLKDNANALNVLAWTIVDPKREKAGPELVKVAVAAAERAVELTEGKSPHIIDTLAKAHFDSGDVAKALEYQEKAVSVAKAGADGKNEDLMKELNERLEQYKKASKQ